MSGINYNSIAVGQAVQEHDETTRAKKVTAVNTSGTQVNPATEEKQDATLFHYKLARLPVPGDTLTYLGYLDKDGNWYIAEIDETNGTMKYVKGTSGFTTAWSNRASNTYEDFNSIF